MKEIKVKNKTNEKEDVIKEKITNKKSSKKLFIISFIILAIIILIVVAFFEKDRIKDVLNLNSKTYKFFNEILNGNEYQIKIKGKLYLEIGDDGGEKIITIAKKGKNSYTQINFTDKDSKLTMFTKGNTTYVLINETKVYFTINKSEEQNNTESSNDNVLMTKEDLNEMKDSKYIKGKSKINGENLYYEEYEDSNGNITQYYFKNNQIKYIVAKNDGEKVEVTEFKNKVDESLFEIPEGYVKKDISSYGI